MLSQQKIIEMLLQEGEGESGRAEGKGKKKKRRISRGLPYVVQIHEGGKKRIKGKGGEVDGKVRKTQSEVSSTL